MAAARPLREVFTDLVGHHGVGGDTAEVLRANGHPDLPNGLVAEAVVNFADTAPIEVSEHLAPFVAANSPVPQVDAPDPDELSWLEALTSAPVPDDVDPAAALDVADLDRGHFDAADIHGGDVHPGDADHGLDSGDADPGGADTHGTGAATGFDFGRGDQDGPAATDPAHDHASGFEPTFSQHGFGQATTPIATDPALLPDDSPGHVAEGHDAATHGTTGHDSTDGDTDGGGAHDGGTGDGDTDGSADNGIDGSADSGTEHSGTEHSGTDDSGPDDGDIHVGL